MAKVPCLVTAHRGAVLALHAHHADSQPKPLHSICMVSGQEEKFPAVQNVDKPGDCLNKQHNPIAYGTVQAAAATVCILHRFNMCQTVDLQQTNSWLLLLTSSTNTLQAVSVHWQLYTVWAQGPSRSKLHRCRHVCMYECLIRIQYSSGKLWVGFEAKHRNSFINWTVQT